MAGSESTRGRDLCRPQTVPAPTGVPPVRIPRGGAGGAPQTHENGCHRAAASGYRSAAWRKQRCPTWLPLFELAGSLVDEDEANVSFGLAEAHADSSMARDDEGTDGYWPSIIVFQSIGSALDHVIALRHLVMGSGVVTNAAPWTIVPGVVEPAALTVWILNGSRRERRQELALRVWHSDMDELGEMGAQHR